MHIDKYLGWSRKRKIRVNCISQIYFWRSNLIVFKYLNVNSLCQGPSRTARRKKAKRQWLREMAKIQEKNTLVESEGLVSNQMAQRCQLLLPFFKIRMPTITAIQCNFCWVNSYSGTGKNCKLKLEEESLAANQRGEWLMRLMANQRDTWVVIYW